MKKTKEQSIREKESIKAEKIIKSTKIMEKGITLIALVVTIIILLILAGVTLNIALSENGLFDKAKQSTEKTKDVTEDEQVKVAITDALVAGAGTLSTDNVREGLKSVFGEEKVNDSTFLGTGPWTFKGERKTYVIETNGNITSKDTTATPTEGKLAKEVLKINPEATEDYEKSPYVTYNNILCRVLYNDDEHGLQLVTIEDLKEVTLGASGQQWEKAAADYNNAVNILNDAAKGYMENAEIALDARCLGSTPELSDGRFQGDKSSLSGVLSNYMKSQIRRL